MDQLNRIFAKNAGDKGWDYKAGQDVWTKAEPMRWTAPPTGAVVALQTPALAALFGWCLLALLAGVWSVRRVRVV